MERPIIKEDTNFHVLLFLCIQHGKNVALAFCAHSSVYYLSAFYNSKSGDAHYSEAGRKLRLFVYIDLAYLSVSKFSGDLVDDRGNHSAGTAPGRPEIQQYGLVGI